MRITRNYKNPNKWAEKILELFQDNVNLMSENPYPDLYESGVVYERENIGVENWQDADELLSNLAGDCEDLACYRAAQYEVSGIGARPEIVKIKEGQYHAVVRMPDGTIEDPSRILIAKSGYHGRGYNGRGKKRAKWRVRRRRNRPAIAFVGLPALEKRRPETAARVKYIYIPGRGRNAVSALGNALENTYQSQNLQALPVNNQGLVLPSGESAVTPLNTLSPDLMQAVMNNPKLQKLAMTNPYTATAFTLLQNPAVQAGLKQGGKVLKRKLRKWF